MTPKEKAEDLFIRNYELIPDYVIKENKIAATLARLFALICIDEILKCNPQSDEEYSTISFWQEVKQEIEKL